MCRYVCTVAYLDGSSSDTPILVSLPLWRAANAKSTNYNKKKLATECDTRESTCIFMNKYKQAMWRECFLYMPAATQVSIVTTVIFFLSIRGRMAATVSGDCTHHNAHEMTSNPSVFFNSIYQFENVLSQCIFTSVAIFYA